MQELRSCKYCLSIKYLTAFSSPTQLISSTCWRKRCKRLLSFNSVNLHKINVVAVVELEFAALSELVLGCCGCTKGCV